MKVTIIQQKHDDSLTKRQRIDDMCSIIEKLDTELVVLPELWNTGFFSFCDYYKNSENAKGETIGALRETAKKKGIYISSGSIVEKDDINYYNTTYFIDPHGRIAAKYRKIHLFGDEGRYLKHGMEPVVCDTDFGKVGLSICYDLRFPELYRRMCGDGAEIFINSSAWPAARVRHWDILIPARALENQAISIFCTCAGENRGIHLGGGSIIADGDGTVISRCGEDAEIVTAEIDVKKNRLFRNTFPVLNDRILL